MNITAYKSTGREAVLPIDMLNDFLTGVLKCDRAYNIIPNLQRLIYSARYNNVPNIFVNDAHRKVVEELYEDPEFSIWGEHAVDGTWGAEVIPELAPTDRDFIVKKPTYSGFHATDLDYLLRHMKINTIILGGMHTDICVNHTASDGYKLGYRIVVPADAVDALDEERHQYGLKRLEELYKATITDVDSIIKEWSRKK